jgi:hypothetical protein
MRRSTAISTLTKPSEAIFGVTSGAKRGVVKAMAVDAVGGVKSLIGVAFLKKLQSLKSVAMWDSGRAILSWVPAIHMPWSASSSVRRDMQF